MPSGHTGGDTHNIMSGPCIHNASDKKEEIGQYGATVKIDNLESSKLYSNNLTNQSTQLDKVIEQNNDDSIISEEEDLKNLEKINKKYSSQRFSHDLKFDINDSNNKKPSLTANTSTSTSTATNSNQKVQLTTHNEETSNKKETVSKTVSKEQLNVINTSGEREEVPVNTENTVANTNVTSTPRLALSSSNTSSSNKMNTIFVLGSGAKLIPNSKNEESKKNNSVMMNVTAIRP